MQAVLTVATVVLTALALTVRAICGASVALFVPLMAPR